MSLPQTAEFTIKGARNAGTKPNPHGGTFDKWYVDLLDPEGKPVRDAEGKTDGAYWQRKSPSEVTEGDVVYGTVSEGEYGLRFKMEKRPDDAPAGSQGGGSFNARPGKSADQQASIVRQHSQESALRYLAITGLDIDPENRMVALEQIVRPIIDWFVEDANNASKSASGAEGTNGTDAGVRRGNPPPPPQASDEQGVHELLTELFEKAGQAGPIATLLTGWVIETQEVEKQDSALVALRDEARAAGVVKWARDGYEAKHGPLPTVDDDTDPIPF